MAFRSTMFSSFLITENFLFQVLQLGERSTFLFVKNACFPVSIPARLNLAVGAGAGGPEPEKPSESAVVTRGFHGHGTIVLFSICLRVCWCHFLPLK